MSSHKVLLVDFGTRHINSLISTIHNIVGTENVRLLRVARPGIAMQPVKFKEVETDVCESSFTLESIRECDKSIVLSGSPDHIGDPAGYRLISRRVLENFDGPIFGICYGHQLVATTWDKTVTMDFKGGQGNATFLPIKTHNLDPIFKSIPMAGYLVAVRHNWSISKVPQDFVKLGETRTSYEIIAGIRHKTKPIYTFQFHPELPVPGFWFGQDMLRNFLSLTMDVNAALV
jgi:GMP synthase-like glutamine amidotransferase